MLGFFFSTFHCVRKARLSARFLLSSNSPLAFPSFLHPHHRLPCRRHMIRGTNESTRRETEKQRRRYFLFSASAVRATVYSIYKSIRARGLSRMSYTGDDSAWWKRGKEGKENEHGTPRVVNCSCKREIGERCVARVCRMPRTRHMLRRLKKKSVKNWQRNRE